LKAQIADELHEAKVRILVIIDDIDRLDHDEVRQLFTVIKALADFPFVTYLLAFDREAAVQAIERDSGLPGARYLEKIIQVPFEIPLIDRSALRHALSARLDTVLGHYPGIALDRERWGGVYVFGIVPLIRVPRDVVRYINAISTTFPAVVDEVNPIDLFAIGAIRIFLPKLYDLIGSNGNKVTGLGSSKMSGLDRKLDAFRSEWVQLLPSEVSDDLQDAMYRLFPGIAGRPSYTTDDLLEWRRDRRICHPDLFRVYFQLSLLPGAVRHGEVMALIAAIATPETFKDILMRAKEETAIGGISKSRALIDRLRDHVASDIAEADIPSFISQLLDIGDELIGPKRENMVFYLSD